MIVYKTIHPSETEDLPWPTYVPENATRIIIGTFPTVGERRYFQFFYPNYKQNPFWKILSQKAGIELQNFTDTIETVNERKFVLQKLKMGITDMGAVILRSNKSSMDNDLFPIEYTNILKILDENPKIDTLILTSKSGPNSVLAWLKNYLILNKISIKLEKEKNSPRKGIFIHNSKTYNILIIHSTSQSTRLKPEVVSEMYLMCL